MPTCFSPGSGGLPGQEERRGGGGYEGRTCLRRVSHYARIRSHHSRIHVWTIWLVQCVKDAEKGVE